MGQCSSLLSPERATAGPVESNNNNPKQAATVVVSIGPKPPRLRQNKKQKEQQKMRQQKSPNNRYQQEGENGSVVIVTHSDDEETTTTRDPSSSYRSKNTSVKAPVSCIQKQLCYKLTIEPNTDSDNESQCCSNLPTTSGTDCAIQTALIFRGLNIDPRDGTILSRNARATRPADDTTTQSAASNRQHNHKKHTTTTNNNRVKWIHTHENQQRKKYNLKTKISQQQQQKSKLSRQAANINKAIHNLVVETDHGGACSRQHSGADSLFDDYESSATTTSGCTHGTASTSRPPTSNVISQLVIVGEYHDIIELVTDGADKLRTAKAAGVVSTVSTNDDKNKNNSNSQDTEANNHSSTNRQQHRQGHQQEQQNDKAFVSNQAYETKRVTGDVNDNNSQGSAVNDDKGILNSLKQQQTSLQPLPMIQRNIPQQQKPGSTWTHSSSTTNVPTTTATAAARHSEYAAPAAANHDDGNQSTVDPNTVGNCGLQEGQKEGQIHNGDHPHHYEQHQQQQQKQKQPLLQTQQKQKQQQHKKDREQHSTAQPLFHHQQEPYPTAREAPGPAGTMIVSSSKLGKAAPMTTTTPEQNAESELATAPAKATPTTNISVKSKAKSKTTATATEIVANPRLPPQKAENKFLCDNNPSQQCIVGCRLNSEKNQVQLGLPRKHLPGFGETDDSCHYMDNKNRVRFKSDESHGTGGWPHNASSSISTTRTTTVSERGIRDPVQMSSNNSCNEGRDSNSTRNTPEEIAASCYRSL